MEGPSILMPGVIHAIGLRTAMIAYIPDLPILDIINIMLSRKGKRISIPWILFFTQIDFLEPWSAWLYAGHFSWLLQEANEIADTTNTRAITTNFFILDLFDKDN
jgi:hypothetical protein